MRARSLIYCGQLAGTLLLLGVCPQSGFPANSAQTKQEQHWRGQLSHILIGMKRANVEVVLHRHESADIAASSQLNAKAGKYRAHTSLYVLDAHWVAAITYDFNGFSEKNNPYMVLHMPSHRVIAPPHLWFRTAAVNKKLHQ